MGRINDKRSEGRLPTTRACGSAAAAFLPDLYSAGAGAFDTLHAEEGRLRRFFQRRMPSREDAADATQETFLRMLAAEKATLIENPQAYLFQIARSVVRASRLRRAVEAQLFLPEIAGLDQPADAPSQERIVNGRQCLLLMAKAIEMLPNRCQQVFILSRLHGMSNGDIARELGISRNMVEKHVIKALLHCRKVRSAISL